jgi:hypothetical protein
MFYVTNPNEGAESFSDFAIAYHRWLALKTAHVLLKIDFYYSDENGRVNIR